MAVCHFLDSNREAFRPAVDGSFAIDKQVDNFYASMVHEVPKLRKVLYEFVACHIFQMDTYVTRIEKTNWELKELGSDNSSYMSDVVRTLKYLHQQMLGLRWASNLRTCLRFALVLAGLIPFMCGDYREEGTAVAKQAAAVLSDDVFDLIWCGNLSFVRATSTGDLRLACAGRGALIYQLMHRLVDGICHIKKFTQEGLALMCLDLQVLEMELKQITSLRCAAGSIGRIRLLHGLLVQSCAFFLHRLNGCCAPGQFRSRRL